ncbi:MAG: hypothetical protein EAY75_08140 [Bacteroidetes bacterium]|nr:MAG: hypothetical protein EAY75_08140 [Bacteroidota bacterium]
MKAPEANAQTITINSGSTKLPMPFATVQNLRAQWARVGTDKGTLLFTEADSRDGDSILISYTGYKPLRMVKPTANITLTMMPLEATLEPVVILPCNGTGTAELRNYKKNKSSWSLGSNEKALATWAAYIPNPDKIKGILTSIHFRLSNTDMPKSATGAPLKVRLFEYNDATGFPGEPFLQKELIVYPKSKDVVIDVSEERLRLPKNGLVVAIDFFYAGEQYIHTHQVKLYRADGSSIDTLIRKYGSAITAVHADNMLGKGYSFGYKTNTWRETTTSLTQPLAPKVELGIKPCD